MEKAWMLSGCLILVVSAFSQVLQVATKAVPAVVYSQPFRQPERPPVLGTLQLIQNPMLL
jgi:hypothetical protein